MRNVLLLLLLIIVPQGLLAEKTYTELLAEIKQDRLSMAKANVSVDSCRAYVMDAFENKVFPYWIGTRWDYNGYSNEPGADKVIACGYFVSTLMKHIGFNWNRFDLAKLYSYAIVKQTCGDIQEFDSAAALIAKVQFEPDNIYFVGLDTHVGIILKGGFNCWFMHSNYYDYKGPDKEKAIESKAFSNSQRYVLGLFLSDVNLDKWLKGTEFPITR